jgi:post-segregation antitoxin (ccd killing protein)
MDKDAIKKVKDFDINISGAAERGIIEYIKEMENIRRENTNQFNNINSHSNRQSSERNIQNKNQWTCRDLNPRPPPCRGTQKNR